MRILIPVDGTPECEAPIPVARELVSTLDADILLVRVVEVIDAFSPLRFDPDVLGMMENAAKYMSGLISRFDLPRDRTKYLVGRGENAADEIVRFVESQQIDLVVMASRCKGWLERLAQGSVYAAVLGSYACPVLGMPVAEVQEDLAATATIWR